MKNTSMNSSKTAARTFGVFFILAFVAYGGGNGLVEYVTGPDLNLASIYAHKTQLITGSILMALVHTFLNIGLVVIMFPILRPYGKTMTYGYLSAAITATLMLVVGAVFLLLLVPVSDEFVKSGTGNTAYLQTLAVLFKKANFFAYQIGMAIWGLGGLMFTLLLYRSKKVPKVIATWGFAGYIVFIAGTIFELFGHEIGLLLDIPGGLFELFLSVWLIIKGFSIQSPVVPKGTAFNRKRAIEVPA